MDSVIKVQNPMTGKWILKKGALYQKLKAQGVEFGRGKRMKKPMGAHLGAVVSDKFARFPVVTYEDKAWGQTKPNSVGQRRDLLANCGKSCFLLPDLKTPKFPVCNKLPLTDKEPTCSYNCKGIKAAASRAGEWKYAAVLEAARKLGQRSKCYVKKDKS